MEVNITQEHIDKGTRGEARSCPISLAINDQCGDYTHTRTTRYSIDVYNAEKREQRIYYHTKESYRFIRDFDAGKEVMPCTVSLSHSHVDPT